MNYELVFGSISLRFVPIWLSGWKQRKTAIKSKKDWRNVQTEKFAWKYYYLWVRAARVYGSIVSTRKSMYNEGKNSDAHTLYSST